MDCIKEREKRKRMIRGSETHGHTNLDDFTHIKTAAVSKTRPPITPNAGSDHALDGLWAWLS